jgi:hypothetical protein
MPLVTDTCGSGSTPPDFSPAASLVSTLWPSCFSTATARTSRTWRMVIASGVRTCIFTAVGHGWTAWTAVATTGWTTRVHIARAAVNSSDVDTSITCHKPHDSDKALSRLRQGFLRRRATEDTDDGQAAFRYGYALVKPPTTGIKSGTSRERMSCIVVETQ